MGAGIRVRVRRIGTGILMAAALVAGAAAVGAPAAVAGKYDGMVRGSSQGDMKLAVTLTQEGDKLTGSMDAGSGQFVFAISDGKVDGTKVTWSFADAQVSGSIEGSFADDAITGTWAASGESGTFEMKRTAAH